MYIYMYICVCVYVCVHTHTHTHTCIHTYIHTYVHKHIDIYMHIDQRTQTRLKRVRKVPYLPIAFPVLTLLQHPHDRMETVEASQEVKMNALDWRKLAHNLCMCVCVNIHTYHTYIQSVCVYMCIYNYM